MDIATKNEIMSYLSTHNTVTEARLYKQWDTKHIRIWNQNMLDFSHGSSQSQVVVILPIHTSYLC